MGTNYYVPQSRCEHCGRGDADVHIGKNLVMFRAYRDDAPSPWGPIHSVEDWRRVLRDNKFAVLDECGREYDVEDFIARIDATHVTERRRQYDWVRDNSPHSVGDFLDDEQFSMTTTDFC